MWRGGREGGGHCCSPPAVSPPRRGHRHTAVSPTGWTLQGPGSPGRQGGPVTPSLSCPKARVLAASPPLETDRALRQGGSCFIATQVSSFISVPPCRFPGPLDSLGCLPRSGALETAPVIHSGLGGLLWHMSCVEETCVKQQMQSRPWPLYLELVLGFRNV